MRNDVVPGSIISIVVRESFACRRLFNYWLFFLVRPIVENIIKCIVDGGSRTSLSAYVNCLQLLLP